jgi:aminomethyltransferase
MDYGDPINEHINTRKDVSVFDVSHMGRYIIKGSGSFDFLQKMVSKDLVKVKEGFMSGPVLLLNEEGGIKDDVMLYKVSEDRWLAVVNAPNVKKDFDWLMTWKQKLGYGDVEIEDVTTKTVLIAIQGPKALDIIESLGFKDAESLKILQFIYEPEILGKKAYLISRSGWTGEEVRSHGFEVWTTPGHGKEIYEAAIKAGAKPAGLIARDTLRIEMGYLLYGADMDENTSPIEARYWLALTLGKTNCVGCDKVMACYERGVNRFRVGLRLKKNVRVIPRHGFKILAGNEVIGEITSGAYSPILNRSIGMGYVKTSHAYIGFKVSVLIRNKTYEAKIVDFPLI